LKLIANIGVDEPKRIYSFYHCKQCVEEVRVGWEKGVEESPESYARLSVGLTDIGLQVWCVRHDMNVAHFSEKA
jgi:hypothetical protein